MALTDVDLASSYFMQRLAATRQGQQLSASMQFDLARSPMSDDELEDVIDQFRDSPRSREGWGLSGMLAEVLSREPKRIPVSDLKALQKNLIAGGYAPPDADANGVWDPSWYASFRRFDRDNFEQQRAGKHWYSAPVYSGMKALTNTLPSRVFQGIVGAAKGTVLQAPETAERVGAVGGLAAGAGIGLVAGGPIGAAVGGGLGAAIGFFADLFGEDKGEEGQSVGGAILDALTPWEEYKDNPKAAWEDLGFVLTAASLVSGLGAAGRGVTGGVKAIEAARATEAGGAVFEPVVNSMIGARAGIAGTQVGERLVSAGPWAKAAMLPTKAAAETELGLFGTIARAASARKALLVGTPGKTADWLARYSPIAFANRLGPKVALDVFGGISQAQMGARLFGGIGQGTKTKLLEAQNALKAELGRDLTEDEQAELEKRMATSTIEKSIAEAPKLQTGVEVPLLGDVVDLASFMLYPQRLLPFSGHKAAINAYKALGGADHMLLAYAHSIQKEQGLGIFEALKVAKREIDPLENTRLRLEFGLHAESHLRVAGADPQGRFAFKRNAVSKARADTIREIRGELAQGGKGESETLRRVMAMSEVDPTNFETWLQELNVQGRGLSRLTDNRKANDLVRGFERRLNKEQGIVIKGEDGKLDLAWLPNTERVRVQKRARDLDILTVRERITKLQRDTARLEKYAERGAISPELSIAARNGARLHRQEIQQLERALSDLQRLNTRELRDGVRLAPARLDFQDKQTIFEKAKQFDRLRDEVLNAPNEPVRAMARQQLENYARQLESEGLISLRQVKTAMTEKPGTAIGVALRQTAEAAAARFDVPPEFAKRLGLDQLEGLGYKLVETGDDVVFPDQLEQMMDLVGVGQYSRRAAVFESIGLSLLKREDQSIAELMALHKRAELGTVLQKHKVDLSPTAAMNRLYEHLDSINHDGAVVGPLRKGKTGKLGLYKTDTRDLSVEEIFSAFEDVPGFTPEVAKDFYGALRKGSAYGGELKLLQPADSFRELGRAMRINGMPGFADLMRTYHGEVPGRLNRRGWVESVVKYKPEGELARSPERKRFEVTVSQVADAKKISPGQRSFAMALMDSTARAQVKLGRFESVDDFYRHVDAQFAERYITGGPTERTLFRVGPNRQPYEELKRLALEFSDSKDWYSRAHTELTDIFAFANKEIELVNGKKVMALDLMTQLIAATSPQKNPLDNFEEALKVFNAYLTGGDFHGSLPNVRGMARDILEGKTIDTWEQPFRTTRKGAPASSRSRMKVWNFYNNLRGDLDKVTVDTWMGRLFDLRQSTTEKLADEVRAFDYDAIEQEIRRVAADTGMFPAEVQASLWAAVKHEAADQIIREAVVREAKGEKVGTLRALADRLRDARSYADIMAEPKIVSQLDDMFGNLNGYALLQRVEDNVMGLTKFGPDFETTMRFFRTADFSTLVHENAHMLRRLVAPEDLAQLERAYGVRPAAPPHGPSEELRGLAAEYHERSGIPMDRVANEEYVDIDEARAMKIADAFEAGKHDPKNPVVRRAYNAFKKETLAQYDFLVEKGYIPVPSDRDPYPDSGSFINDVRDKKTLRYFKSGDLGDNPLGAKTGRVVKDIDGNDYEQSYNDIFRWVHDIFGHSKEGLQTGARGEENAWRQHARMYSPEARKAMTTETRGQNSWVNFGPHLRQEGRVPRKGEPGFVGPTERPYAEQKVMLLPDEYSRLDYPFSWPREAEERFARDAERYVIGKVQPGHAPGAFQAVRDAVGALWASMRHTAVETNAVPRGARKVMDKYFADAFDMVPETRLARTGRNVRSKQVVAGAVLGAGAGALEGDQPSDILRGAAIGAGIGLGTRMALNRTYGYLPDALSRMNTALRYTLSLTFDAGRISEQNMIAMAKFNLPPMFSPVKHIKGREWRTPFTAGTVTGDAAWRDTIRLWDEINGTQYFQNIDDLDRRMYQAGMLGFSPRNWEAAQAMQLYQRGWSAEKIRDAVTQIGRYGTGRTAAEKTANFIVFPFSFSKKLLTTLGDFVLQQPGRNLLLHEGMRRFQESEYDDKVQDFIRKHLPMLEDLKTINNLAFGLSPGRFFLQGLSDHRSGVGKAAQLMSSFFVPSGAATSLGEAAGNAADLAVNAFVPLVLTGESINRAGGVKDLDDVVSRYVPFIRELDQYFLGREGEPGALGRQITALKEGADPYYQFSEYQDELRRAKAEQEPFALAMGYSSVDGLLGSEFGGAVQAQLDAKKQELNSKYPSGFRMSQEFTNTDNLDAQALVDLSNKAERSSGEDGILKVFQHIQQQKYINDIIGLDPQLAGAATAQSVRAMAEKFAGDRRFLELWDRFFLREYGPLRRVA